MMYAAYVLYPVRVLGPGERIGIWFAGCPRRCPSCSNPELWEQEERYRTEPSVILGLVERIAQAHPIDGFTLTGGDPFFQPEALAELLPHLRKIAEDILVYTGYQYEELLPSYKALLSQITVLIDGAYIEARNVSDPLRGSDNQRIFYHDDAARQRYSAWMEGTAGRIQNFQTRSGMISVGIHRPDYPDELKRRLQQKGVLTYEP